VIELVGDLSGRRPRCPTQITSSIVLDTLGKLHARGHGVGGYCLACQRVFSVSLPALIKERGGDSKVVGMRPLTCPGCQGRRTTFQITAPARGGT
jgi:hypothetical protein